MANESGPRRLKIIGSFGPLGTKVVDVDTGEQIRNVRKVIWTHEAGDIPHCTLELVHVTCEGEAILERGADFAEMFPSAKTDTHPNVPTDKPRRGLRFRWSRKYDGK